MIDIPARKLLNAIEGGDIESQVDDGFFTLFIDLKPQFTIPAEPILEIHVSFNHRITVSSGTEVIAEVAADSAEDAELIADWIGDLLAEE